MAAAQELFEHQFKEFEKFSMFTPAPGVPNRRSRLVWSSYRGNPRITVFTGVPDDLEKGVLRAPMNPETFNSLMDKLDSLITAPVDTRYILDNLTAPKKEDGTTDMFSEQRIKISETWIGKDKNGIIWISIRAENRPSIVFKFTLSDFHKWRNGDGTDFSDAESSAAQVLGVTYGVKKGMAVHAALLKPPYDPEAKKAGPGGKTPYKKPVPTSFDADDIMF